MQELRRALDGAALEERGLVATGSDTDDAIAGSPEQGIDPKEDGVSFIEAQGDFRAGTG
jgi:hypothetical protein